MHKTIALLLVFVFSSVFLAFPVFVNAQLAGGLRIPSVGTNLFSSGGAGAGFTSGAGGGGFFGAFNPCADPTSCAITIAIAVFLQVFGGKLACLFGSENDMFAKGLTSQTVVKNSSYDNLPGIKSLTDTTGPFGGQILTKQPCKCGGKLGVKEVIMVGPPRRTMVAVTSGTKIYDFRSFNTGNWVLGRSTGEVVCRVPKALAISEIGTSR